MGTKRRNRQKSRFLGVPDVPLTVGVTGAFIANGSVAVLRAARAGHGIALPPEV
jgi:hypothetical protein